MLSNGGGVFRNLFQLKGVFFSIFFVVFVVSPLSIGYVGPNDVLVLVNANSPTSRYVAKLYRQYHPDINESQVLYLSGLVDCSGPNSTAADEIISRDDFEMFIADTVRDYLVSFDKVNTVKLIITTAGMPYRIEDSAYGGIIQPGGGSTSYTVWDVDAASVESELAVLFLVEPNAGMDWLSYDRIVNPYQCYRSGIELFSRNILSNRYNMDWTALRPPPGATDLPFMEGVRSRRDPYDYGKHNRKFSGGDMYLTCRLDGPKNQGESAVFSVSEMLERARRASSPDYGIDYNRVVAVFDDAPGDAQRNSNRVFNLPFEHDYNIYSPNTPQPPDTYYVVVRDDYKEGFEQMTGHLPAPYYFNVRPMVSDHNLAVVCDTRLWTRTNQADFNEGKVVVALTGLGVNGDEGSSGDYIKTGGPNDTPLFNLAYGAVFYSLESFNAATMFSDVQTSYNQGKIIDFLSIGGCGAIGHSFEPRIDAEVDTEFFFYNLLADDDNDGFADMTFIESAFTAIPYLSWTELVIGDPLMRIAYGPACQEELPALGDIDGDGQVATMADLGLWTEAYLGRLYSEDEEEFDIYDDLCDLNRDWQVDLRDFTIFAELFMGNSL